MGVELTLVDIGASGGVHPRWSELPCDLRAVLFEPDPEEFRRLKAAVPANWIVLNSALSHCSERVFFNFTRKPQVSSVYTSNRDILDRYPDARRFDTMVAVKTNTDTLDNQLKGHGIKDVDFIKIDVEGHALPILQGSVETLKDVIGVEVEVDFLPTRRGQCLFPEIHVFLTSLGFELMDLRRYFWRRRGTANYGNTVKGQLAIADALYLRPPDGWVDAQEQWDFCHDKSFRAAVICLAYGYFDLAEIVARSVRPPDRWRIDLALEKQSYKRRLPDFRGKGRIYNVLSSLADVFAVGGDKGTYSGTDPRVGNL